LQELFVATVIEEKRHTAARYLGNSLFERHTADFSLRPGLKLRSMHPRLWDVVQARVAPGGSEKLASHDVAVTCIRRVNIEAPASALSNSDRRGVVVSSTQGARRNFAALDQMGGELRSLGLSTMELRVLDLVRIGKTTKEIAARLCIPERTVELHIRHGLRRLRARSAEELLSLIAGCH
jgi:DNA-binding NarL/FixJ family response regulator